MKLLIERMDGCQAGGTRLAPEFSLVVYLVAVLLTSGDRLPDR